MDLRAGQVFLKEGQMFVVPKEVEHRTHAGEGFEIIMFKPETTLNTGDVTGDRTVSELEWL